MTGLCHCDSTINTIQVSVSLLLHNNGGLVTQACFFINIIKSRSNLSCLLFTFRQHLLLLSKWLPVPIFSARCRCCGEKCIVEMWQGICPRISVHRVSLNILLVNFGRFTDPSCWACCLSRPLLVIDVITKVTSSKLSVAAGSHAVTCGHVWDFDH